MFQPHGRGWSARRPGRSRRAFRSSSSQSRFSHRPQHHHEVSDGGVLESMLLEALNKSHPQPMPFHDIMKSTPVKYKKTEINHQLYEMQNKKLVDRSQEDPPQWFVLQKGRQAHENKTGITSSFVELSKHGTDFATNKPERLQSSSFSFSFAEDAQNKNLAPASLFLNQSGATLPRFFSPKMHTNSNVESAENSETSLSAIQGGVPPSRPDDDDKQIKQEPLCQDKLDEENQVSDVSKDADEYTPEQDINEADLPPLICDDEGMDVEKRKDDERCEESSSSSASFSTKIDEEMIEASLISREQSLDSDVSRISLDPISDKLFKVLSVNPRVPIADFVKMFKGVHSKKQLNQALYSMAKKGLVSRSQENPPMWFLENKALRILEKNLSGESDQKSLSGNSYSDSYSAKSDELPTRQHSAGLLGRRPFPAQCLKQMEAVAISSRGDASIPDAQGCPLVSESQPFSDPSYPLNPPPSKIPRMDWGSSFKDPTKNPVSQLMEYVQAKRLKIDFKVDVRGPDHRKRFYMTVILGSETFSPVEGGSKKDAKTKACEYVLDVIGQTKTRSGPFAGQPPITAQATPMRVSPPLQQPAIPLNAGTSNKNAVSLVNEYAQANNFKIEFFCDSFGPDHRKSFRTVLKIDKTTFSPVEGASKKDSKLKAAEAALLVLQSTGKLCVSASSNSASAGPQQINTFHDRVAKMVNDKFHSLLLDLPDTVVGRKILAGFVMSRTVETDAGDETQWTVISIGSGNRCVGGDKLSMKGETVNDCHAEVIARRGLLRFMYKEIQDYRANPDDDENILTASADQKKLTLKPGIEFHLYISTAPCGDSALFAKNDLREAEPSENPDENHAHCPLYENKKQGILRTKVENGEGCIPIDNEALVPTWDGLLRGERMRTMSCSDKIAKWNFVGLQGALLSHFLQPFYMTSLTLGMLYSHGHLTRAVCCRVEKFMNSYASDSISPLYKVHHPQVAKVSGDDPSRDTGKMKTREYSLNWVVGDARAEVLDGTKGRCEARYGSLSPVSQVSKSLLYAEFKKISEETYPSYCKAKEAVPDYRHAAEEMKKAFEQAECGTWMNKPSEVEEF